VIEQEASYRGPLLQQLQLAQAQGGSSGIGGIIGVGAPTNGIRRPPAIATPLRPPPPPIIRASPVPSASSAWSSPMTRQY
jgi:hypothetical protein